MPIPTHILEESRMFCEKLQNLTERIAPYIEESKHDDSSFVYLEIKYTFLKNEAPDPNFFKTFLGKIISSFLHSKRFYDLGKSPFFHTNKTVFFALLQEYNDFLTEKKNPNNLMEIVPLNLLADFYGGNTINYFESYLRQGNLFGKNLSEWCWQLYDWLVGYSSFINQKETCQFNTSRLNYTLKYFSITNFQCIRHIEAKLPVDAQFIVFTGENGDGKTSILQALGLGLYNSEDLTDTERGFNSAIQVQYAAYEKSFHNEIYNNYKYPTLYTLRYKMHELKAFAAYGASRLKVVENRKLENPLLNLDTNKAKLFNIFESWLRDISVNEPNKFTFIKDLLERLLPNVSEIRKKEPHKTISDFVFVEKGNTVEFEHLSAGHKSIVLMMGDMIMRLSEAQPEIMNPTDLEGIVLIDELESHLHPKWQREFPRVLSEALPKVQFIVTTHSAVCLLGMPENTVLFKVNRTETEGTLIERLDIDIKNLLPNQILTSPLFNLDSIRSVKNEGIEKLFVEDTFEEIIKNKESQNLLKELSAKFKTPKS